ncbi:DUF72 domain-containing protein [Stratiformator vulcanicus]|uniref:DUF72 domain-containing protein n=1 Tax=Stratiformator vulcanicus TaxID=2527980 RepID=A0A517R1Q2_9PLAN|nr:DUF72 domain-containing protein [Stratiformator vulcanicus]QDT37790.1 hypothetical protein Pan189_21720 [Stratiformator vulcanicus]
MHWRLGTTGYYNEGWRGPFFPPALPKSKWLGHYATQFDTIEMNNTFHRAPDEVRVRRWSEQVPDSFRFCVKAWRGITHDAPLSEARRSTELFLEPLRSFEHKLGIVLFQLPPDCGINQFAALEVLLGSLPTDIRFAIEFRNATWFCSEVDQLLSSHRVARVAAELERHPESKDATPTADFVYARLLGRHGRFQSDDHELFDPTPLLRQWHARLATATLGQSETAWVFINNDLAGHAPATLRRFADIAGVELPQHRPPETVVKQGKLFDM